jgi:type I pantothenate kinase
LASKRNRTFAVVPAERRADDARDVAPYRIFSRAEWAGLRSNTPLSLTDADLSALRGLNDHISLSEVADIHLPLSRLLNLQVAAARNLAIVQDAFLGRPATSPPYVVGIAGSVSVGKSTFARVLQAVLAQWPDHPHVELVTTDGFLLPTSELEARGLMSRKGFPESYDLRAMIDFLTALKAGQSDLSVPVYSHLTYDVVQGKRQAIKRPDILIFEGLNVLQTSSSAPLVASDFFDFSIYIDAAEADIETWYVQRFLLLQQTAFQQSNSYFHRYRDLPPVEARAFARQIWREINLANLQENILPTRPRARLVLRKGADHAVDEVWLRRV